MAEVPEVEIIVRDLRDAMVGRKIRSVEVIQPAAVRFPTVDEFTTLLKDRTILDARRRAKYILLPLSGDLLLTVHFALWGTLMLVPAEQPRLPETLIIWHFDRDQDLRQKVTGREYASLQIRGDLCLQKCIDRNVYHRVET